MSFLTRFETLAVGKNRLSEMSMPSSLLITPLLRIARRPPLCPQKTEGRKSWKEEGQKGEEGDCGGENKRKRNTSFPNVSFLRTLNSRVSWYWHSKMKLVAVTLRVSVKSFFSSQNWVLVLPTYTSTSNPFFQSFSFWSFEYSAIHFSIECRLFLFWYYQ